jgi:hypothetical protein
VLSSFGLAKASEIAIGTKFRVDPTKTAGKGSKRLWPPLIKMDEALKANVEKPFGGNPR